MPRSNLGVVSRAGTPMLVCPPGKCRCGAVLVAFTHGGDGLELVPEAQAWQCARLALGMGQLGQVHEWSSSPNVMPDRFVPPGHERVWTRSGVADALLTAGIDPDGTIGRAVLDELQAQRHL